MRVFVVHASLRGDTHGVGARTIDGSHARAKEQLFDYIEVFYNEQRRHSALGYVSPAEHERATRSKTLAAKPNCLPERIKPTRVCRDVG